VKIAFATVSGVLSEMATNSLFFENALVKLKMHLLLLPEATVSDYKIMESKSANSLG
jgi:hypothetical protein